LLYKLELRGCPNAEIFTIFRILRKVRKFFRNPNQKFITKAKGHENGYIVFNQEFWDSHKNPVPSLRRVAQNNYINNPTLGNYIWMSSGVSYRSCLALVWRMVHSEPLPKHT
jgi:hypothetical protein